MSIVVRVLKFSFKLINKNLKNDKTKKQNSILKTQKGKKKKICKTSVWNKKFVFGDRKLAPWQKIVTNGFMGWVPRSQPFILSLSLSLTHTHTLTPRLNLSTTDLGEEPKFELFEIPPKYINGFWGNQSFLGKSCHNSLDWVNIMIWKNRRTATSVLHMVWILSTSNRQFNVV